MIARQHRDHLARYVADGQLRDLAEQVLDRVRADLERTGHVIGHAVLFRAGRAPESARAPGCADAREIVAWLRARPTLAARLVCATPTTIYAVGQPPALGLALRVEDTAGPLTVLSAHVLADRTIGELQTVDWAPRWLVLPTQEALS
jgi:hypothetical protein